MNLSFLGNDLYRGFNLVSSIIPTTAVKNVLNGVKLTFGYGQVELTATDLEVLVRYTLPVKEKEVEGNGGIVLPASYINPILREWATSEEVLMSIEGNTCKLRSRGGYFKIMGEDPAQFPGVSVGSGENSVVVDGEIVSDMVEKVVGSVSSVRTRNALCGVFVRVEGENITMVGADGNRLSSVRRKVDNPNKVLMNGIATVKCLTFLQRFVSECKGTLKVIIDESRIRFIGSKGEIISQLIDGQYPRYEEVVPKQNDKKVVVDREELLSMMRIASYMTSEGCRIVKFILGKEKLMLSSRAANIGEAELEVRVDYDGTAFEIGFNPDYVLEALKVADADRVTIELGESNGAALFRTGHEQMCVIMPIELEGVNLGE
ncbi:MAG: DNA polymerase III subunit beta [Planctomycetes bacterium]|nr:DNA polymerase III subunit beta [Planctomycetota bacterium]